MRPCKDWGLLQAHHLPTELRHSKTDESLLIADIDTVTSTHVKTFLEYSLKAIPASSMYSFAPSLNFPQVKGTEI